MTHCPKCGQPGWPEGADNNDEPIRYWCRDPRCPQVEPFFEDREPESVNDC